MGGVISMPLFTTGGGPSTAATQARLAAREKARSQALERRHKRDAAWMEKRIGEIGKGDALKDINLHWQSYTPFEMSLLLNNDDVAQAVEARIMRVAAIFESVRNMLIIVPIMLTWLSLALAGAAYENNLTAAKPNGKPFLQQWQEGFAPLTTIHLLSWHIPLLSHGLHGDRWFTFANFALTDATLLCVILILTVIGQALEIWSYRRSTRVAELLERHMYTLNSRTLLGSIATDPDAKMPPWLRELRTDLGKLREVIDKMNVGLDASMDHYKEAISQQEKAVSALVDDTQKVHDSVVQLNRLYQGGTEAARIYQKYIPTVTQDIAKLSHAQQRSMTSMEAQVDMLAKSMRYLGEMTGHVREAQRTIDRYYDAGGRTTGRTPAYQPHPSYRPEPPEPKEPPAHPRADDPGSTQRDGGMPDGRANLDRDGRGAGWEQSGQPTAPQAGWSAPANYESYQYEPYAGQPDGGYPDGGYPDGVGGWDYDDGATLPRPGFWRRLRYRLSSIPVVRVVVRRPR